jgi:MFS family permease
MAQHPSKLIKSIILLSSLPLSVAIVAIAPILPKMSAELAHTAMDAYLVKMVVGIGGIAFVIGGPIAGYLIDKIALRPLFVGACLVFSVAGVVPYVLDSLPFILVMRFLMDICSISCQIIGAALVAKYFGEVQRAKWMGVFAASATAIALVGLYVGGYLGDLGWRQAFLIHLSGLPMAVLGWVALAREEAPAPEKNDSVATSAQSKAPFPWGLALIAFLIGIIIYVPSIYIPFHMASIGFAKPSAISTALMFSTVVSMTTASQFGRIRTFVSSTTAFCFSFAGVAAGIAIIALATTYPMVLVGLSVMGLGIGWLFPNLMASTADVVDEAHRGRTLGIVRSIELMAPAIGVTALEPLVRHIGANGILLLVVATAILISLSLGVRRLRMQ